MATKVQEIARMIDMLPEQEQELAFQLIKRMVLAWDPDFTRVTPDEAASIHAAEDSGRVVLCRRTSVFGYEIWQLHAPRG